MSAPQSDAQAALTRASSDVIGPSKPRLWKILGPGLITGAADDDPSGIVTYAQAGAQFEFGLAWTLILTYPLMVAIQAICARIGRTTGRGIAANVRRHYAPWILHVTVALLFVANICNIGADLGAMAEASRLLLPRLPAWVFLLLFSVICATGQIFLHHTRYVAILKWLTLSLLAYLGTLCVVHVDWGALLRGLLMPHMLPERGFWLTVVAIFGTTISPYLFFWQASQEVEDTKTEPVRQPLSRRPEQGPDALSRIRFDTMIGMGVSNVVALAILTTAGATLHANGVQQLDTAAQAAQALRPIAGDFAFVLFAVGIIGTGLLSVPVLAGSAAYAIGEARRWKVGLSRKPSQAKGFYATIAAATAVGAAANLFDISPVKALVWSAALNALVSVPVMVLVMRIAADVGVMGAFAIRTWWKWLGWAAVAVMAAASTAFLYSLIV